MVLEGKTSEAEELLSGGFGTMEMLFGLLVFVDFLL